MDKVNIVIMGKTGAGKSTIVNSILQEDVAPTGMGQAVTTEPKIYTQKVLLPIGTDGEPVPKCISLYDTVGLEIDSGITGQTLDKIQEIIKETRKKDTGKDISLVWFCVNNRSNRFEPYEIDLIKKLSSEYEIPFVVVITQCYSDEMGELEKQIKRNIQEIAVRRILAKDCKLKTGLVEAFGLTDLLCESINKYDTFKIKILESKLKTLDLQRNSRLKKLKGIDGRAKLLINHYSDKAEKVGWISVVCIPIVHGMAVKLIADLIENAGLNSLKDLGGDVLANFVLGLIATPFMGVPVLSAGVAGGYISAVGESFQESLMAALTRSTEDEWRDSALMMQRIKTELRNRKK